MEDVSTRQSVLTSSSMEPSIMKLALTEEERSDMRTFMETVADGI
jgi:hypothetical protein